MRRRADTEEGIKSFNALGRRRAHAGRPVVDNSGAEGELMGSDTGDDSPRETGPAIEVEAAFGKSPSVCDIADLM